MPLGQAFDPAANSLGFLRLMLAFLVIVQHSFELGPFGDGRDALDRASGGAVAFGSLAVAGFFVLSGFLITRSFLASRSTAEFVFRRILRIFPAFWACLIMVAFVLAPIAWQLDHGSLSGFLTARPSPGQYVLANLPLVSWQSSIGDVFSENPYPNIVNGSLWTLQYEFACYIGVACLGVLGLLRRPRLVLAIATVPWLMIVGGHLVPADVAAQFRLSSIVLPLALSFALGMLLYLYRERVIVSTRWAVLAGTVLLLSLSLGMYDVVGHAALAYLCLFLGIRLPLRRVGRRVDISYGLYIYAFPVQQLLTLSGFSRHGLGLYIAATTGITSTLALISWVCVERPCQRFGMVPLTGGRSIAGDRRSVARSG